MRSFSVGAKGLFMAAAVTTASGLISAFANEAPVRDLAPKTMAANTAIPADARPEPSSIVEPATTAADPATPCQFVPHAQAALVLAAAQKNGGVDEYGKLMSVPEDGTGSNGDLPATNRRVRDILAARPEEELVICVAGCGNADRVVFAQPSEKRISAAVPDADKSKTLAAKAAALTHIARQ